jgi:hypothetical protein
LYTWFVAMLKYTVPLLDTAIPLITSTDPVGDSSVHTAEAPAVSCCPHGGSVRSRSEPAALEALAAVGSHPTATSNSSAATEVKHHRLRRVDPIRLSIIRSPSFERCPRTS